MAAQFKEEFEHNRVSNFALHARRFMLGSGLSLLFGDNYFVQEGRYDPDTLLAAARGAAIPFCLTAVFPYICVPLMRIHILKRLLIPHEEDARGFGVMMAHFDRSIKAHNKQSGECILTNILSAHNPTKELPVTPADIKAESLLLMSASPDTTSPLASALLASLIQNPSSKTKVQSELNQALKSNTIQPNIPIPWTSLSHFPYFTACLYETARLFPPVVSILPFSAPDSGLHLPDGRFVPGGTAIGAAAGVINRNKTVFGVDADMWRPERWLGGREEVAEMHRYLFTWGFGARRCTGQKITVMLCGKLVLQMLRELEIEPAVGDLDAVRKEGMGFALYDGFYVKCRPR